MRQGRQPAPSGTGEILQENPPKFFNQCVTLSREEGQRTCGVRGGDARTQRPVGRESDAVETIPGTATTAVDPRRPRCRQEGRGADSGAGKWNWARVAGVGGEGGMVACVWGCARRSLLPISLSSHMSPPSHIDSGVAA